MAKLSSEEQKALQARLKESQPKKNDSAQVLTFIQTLPDPDRSLALLLHEIILAEAPHLRPRTWYGMPAYANPDGKVVCFFQPATKFKTRYATIGFTDAANLDREELWPVAFAIVRASPQVKAQLQALIRQAIPANE